MIALPTHHTPSDTVPFTETQRTQFIALLQSKGWLLRDGTIWAPRGGLWFSDSHFANWSPSRMHVVFSQRAARIAKSLLPDSQARARENQEASWAAEEVIEK